MLFSAALELLKLGKFVVRAGWVAEEGYLALMPGMIHLWKILPHPKPNAGNHILSVSELSADDWKEFEGFKEEAPSTDAA
jgi:hypothetical protein